ncbi:phospholipid/cholesterol/gamma-HCH transport system substrate-binding protein [Bryocella elongata]|uniref:Phospholipid/cholesterol/gamma-HCH transport system substrate-binding protein n=1 Tax=Bryocella elongata TaxID=863522 RepID=A0A1H6BPK5_9BACT|nr:MlaD family protein [Bryocella elongata]SEG62146.1 phospholipid/cholesterol/gamma-HCH transport system substrate-binding protein [Bryocella elongata]
MPSQQEVKWSQLKVGVIVIVSTTLLCILIFLMTSASGFSLFSHKMRAYVYLSNSGGLKVGAPVGLEGVTIGEVKKVQIIGDPARKLTPVKVTIEFNPKFHADLHTDSVASLTTIGVLGDTVLDINSKSATGPEIQDGAELHTADGAGIASLMDAGQKTIQNLNQTLAKLDGVVSDIQSGKGTIGKLITDPQLYIETRDTIHQLNVLSTNLNSGKGTVGKLLTDPQAYDRLNDATLRLDNITKKIDSGQGTVGKLLNDSEAYDNLNSTLKHANSLLAEADAGKGTLGLLTKDPAFAKKLDDTVTQLDTLMTGVNQGKGTLGKFATDDAAYTNVNKLLTASTDLVTTIRKDPRKYLTIHLKIF